MENVVCQANRAYILSNSCEEPKEPQNSMVDLNRQICVSLDELQFKVPLFKAGFTLLKILVISLGAVKPSAGASGNRPPCAQVY